jgi:hypothetical protein
MPSALSWTPDPLRHIARLPYLRIIDGKKCIKVYATDWGVVYLPYGWESPYNVYQINRINNNEEVLGELIAAVSDLISAQDLAGKETAP